MKPAVFLAGAAAVLSTVLTANTSAQSTSAQATSSKDTVTVTGCLQSGATSDAYTLSNAMQASASSTTSTGAAGSTSASASSAGKGNEKYDLVASGSVDLKPHVGHKVEITGTLADTQASSASGSTTPSASSTASTATKKLNVTAIKHVAASCP